MRQYLFVLLIAVIVMGCSKEKPEACFDIIEKGFVVRYHDYNSCSQNAEYVFWEFGDGKGMDGSKVSYKYNSPGTYNVKLSAYSEDGFEKDVMTQAVEMTYKVVDSIKVSGLKFNNPQDLIARIGSTNAKEVHSVTTNEFPIVYTFPGGLELKNSIERIAIFDPNEAIPLINMESRMHSNYSNPFILSGKNYNIEMYWHFKD